MCFLPTATGTPHVDAQLEPPTACAPLAFFCPLVSLVDVDVVLLVLEPPTACAPLAFFCRFVSLVDVDVA